MKKRASFDQRVVSVIAMALSVAAINIVPAVAGDAEGAGQANHCVQRVSEGGKGAAQALPAAPPQCFASFSEAISFATDGAVVIPEDMRPEEQLDALGDSLAALPQDKVVNSVVIAVDYNYKNYKAGSLTWTASSNCTSGLGYFANSMPDGWNNKASSTRGFGDCSENIVFEHNNRTGAQRTCRPNCSDLESLSNEVSSREWNF